ncbi:MAG: anaerobic ribonucleoside-triphosphate reductase activating protein [Oscillospiraceae bacterium]|nr:anaerobic ribonucleoside-triphosphate reductase activating protein [Oscillospiraceae bacterium]
MRISGLMKLTLLDFPGHTACTVFTGGCNYRCPFCHNAELVLRPEEQPEIPEAEFFALLEKRRGLLDGVAVTGGEPTLQPDLPEFLRRIRDLGYAVKLDTNGTRPDLLKRLVQEGLVQYAAMDIKNSPARYAETAGTADPQLDRIRESAAFLLAGTVPYEFRTTVVQELHRPEDLQEIGRWLRGAERYFLQGFTDSGDLIREGLHPCSREELDRLLAAVKPFIPAAELRGVD